MVNYYQFNHYLKSLCHPNERHREDALQDLFFTLLKGENLHPEQWERLIPILVCNAMSSNDDVRRWSYQVGVFSHNNNKMLVDLCANNLTFDRNRLNRTWMMALLAENMSPEDFNSKVLAVDHELTNENIDLARYLFSECPKIDFNEVLRHADPLSLMWVASIGAYKNIAIKNKREPFITSKELSIMTTETDNDEVLKHVMYALLLQDTFSVQSLPFSPFEYNKMGNQQKKWFFTLLWRDFEYMSANIDFAKEMLGKGHLFSDSLSSGAGKEVRIGLARGLANSCFIDDISTEVVDWYSHEDSLSTRYYLVQYIKRNQNTNRNFREIVEYLKSHGDETLKRLVLLDTQYDAQGFITDTTTVISSSLSLGELLSFISKNNANVILVNFEKGAAFMQQEYHNVNQVANFEGNNNQANYFHSQTDLLKSDLNKLMMNASESEKGILKDALDSVNEKDESKLTAVLKKLVDIGSHIFSKVAADCVVAYMRAKGLIQ